MMDIATRHWMIALPAAVLMHAAVATAVLWSPPDPGARRAGLGGIEVGLGPAPGSPGGVASPAPVPADAAVSERVPPVAPATAVPVESPVQPVPMNEAALLEIHDAVEAKLLEAESSKAHPARIVEAVFQQPAFNAMVRPPSPVTGIKPVEVAVARAVAPPKMPTPTLQPERPARLEFHARPQRQHAAKSAPTRAIASSDEEIVAAITPSQPGEGGKAGTRTSTPDATGGGIPGAAADYMAYLRAWLQKYKEYPHVARRRRQQGTALLYFVMDREGRVHERRVRRSSGYALLDKEVLALIARAEPLPLPPPEVHGERIKLLIPVNFSLR